jgi:uncharacterized protein DUF5670
VSASGIFYGRIGRGQQSINGEFAMLWTIAVILLILWLLGFTMHFAGGLIHLLLVLAIIVALVRMLQGRRPV